MLRPFFTGAELPVLQTDTGRPQCGACGFYKQCKSPKLSVAGRGRKKILVVSAFPGADEDKAGKWEAGECSNTLRTAMSRAGADLDRDCWLTGALICKPGKGTSPEAAVDYCRPNLVKTVAALNPRVVVTLGSEAVMSLMGFLWRPGEGGAFRWRGFRIPNRQLNAWVVPTYHPGLLLRERDPVFDQMFAADLKTAVGFRERPYTDPPAADMGDQVWITKDPTEAAAEVGALHRKSLRDDRPVAFDFETTCLKPDGGWSRMVTCAVSDGQTTLAYPWGKETKAATKALLEDRRVRKVGANAKFEDRYCRRNGITVRGWWWDVNLAAHAIDNASKIRSVTPVDFQAVARLGVRGWDGGVHPFLVTPKDSGGYAVNQIHTIDIVKVLRYNGLDALYEMLICHDQRKQLGLDPERDG